MKCALTGSNLWLSAPESVALPLHHLCQKATKEHNSGGKHSRLVVNISTILAVQLKFVACQTKCWHKLITFTDSYITVTWKAWIYRFNGGKLVDVLRLWELVVFQLPMALSVSDSAKNPGNTSFWLLSWTWQPGFIHHPSWTHKNNVFGHLRQLWPFTVHLASPLFIAICLLCLLTNNVGIMKICRHRSATTSTRRAKK